MGYEITQAPNGVIGHTGTIGIVGGSPIETHVFGTYTVVIKLW